MDGANGREAFEELVADTAQRHLTGAAVRAELGRQILYQPEPSEEGLDELAVLLAQRLAGGVPAEEAIEELEQASGAQPLVRLYSFALHREAGAEASAHTSLDALLALDPDDPIAVALAARGRGQIVRAASEEVRLANIAKFAATPLLANPYSLAVGVLFETIRERGTARV